MPQKYTSALRTEQAAATRRRVIEAAAELFAARGYARTTLARIAAAAGVSVETVQAQGSKRSLLSAAVRLVTFGRETDERFVAAPEAQRLVEASSPDEFTRVGAQLVSEFNSRTYRLWRAFGSAAADDPDVDQEWSESMGSIRSNIAELVALLDSRGWLRTDLEPEELAVGVWLLSTGELYEKLIVRVGWTPDLYEDWLTRSLRELLFA